MTPQNYEELVQIYAEYQDKGLEIIAYPCNQFADQEPGTAAEIIQFQSQYNVTFPVVEKIDVNGPNADPAWTWMRESNAGPTVLLKQDIEWNFHKYLIKSNGQVAFSYEPHHSPAVLKYDIEQVLGM